MSQERIELKKQRNKTYLRKRIGDQPWGAWGLLVSMESLIGYRLTKRQTFWSETNNYWKETIPVYLDNGLPQNPQPSSSTVYRERINKGAWTTTAPFVRDPSSCTYNFEFYSTYSSPKLGGLGLADNSICLIDEAQISPLSSFFNGQDSLALSFNSDYVIELTEQQQDSLQNYGDRVYGSFFRYFYANNKYLWTAGHKQTGESYLWDIEDAVLENNMSKVKYLGMQVSWGARRTTDPLLNVEGTNIFTNTTHDQYWLWVFDITNYKNFADSNPVPRTDTEDSNDNLPLLYDMMNYQDTNYYTSTYDNSSLKTTSSARLRYQGAEVKLNAEVATVHYYKDNNVYMYNSFYGAWNDPDAANVFDHGFLSVGVFDKTVANSIDGTNSSLKWTNQKVLNSEDVNDMGLPLELKHNNENIKPRVPFLLKNIGGKDYLYLIDRNEAKGLAFRIDNNPGLENALPNNAATTPANSGIELGLGEIVPFEVGVQVGNFLYCVSSASSLDHLPWNQEYLGSINPAFSVVDVSNPESPNVMKAIWAKVFTEYNTSISRFAPAANRGPAQLYYCEDEELMIFCGYATREILYFDVIDPANPIFRKIQTLERTAEQGKYRKVERLNGSGSLIFVVCGGDITWEEESQDVGMITLNIKGLGNSLRSENKIVTTTESDYKLLEL